MRRVYTKDYDFIIYKDNKLKDEITRGLNIALSELTDCLTKEDSDEWVEIIYKWFPTALEYYPEKEEEIRAIEPQVKQIVQSVKDNYLQNEKIVFE